MWNWSILLQDSQELAMQWHKSSDLLAGSLTQHTKPLKKTKQKKNCWTRRINAELAVIVWPQGAPWGAGGREVGQQLNQQNKHSVAGDKCSRDGVYPRCSRSAAPCQSDESPNSRSFFSASGRFGFWAERPPLDCTSPLIIHNQCQKSLSLVTLLLLPSDNRQSR